MPRVIIAAIGDELLKGKTLNSNAHFLSHLLTEEGFEVQGHVTSKDAPKSIRSMLEWGFQQANVVISTGGLGPTCDDLTKAIASEYMGYSLQFNPDVAQEIQGRLGSSPSIQNQATLPEGAPLLKNNLGTAYGMVLEKKGKLLILMPGVPPEMKAMAKSALIPFLVGRFPPIEKGYQQTFYLTMREENQVDPFLRTLSLQYPHVSIGIYPAYGHLTVRFSSKEGIDKVCDAFEKEFEEYLYDSEDGTIEGALYQLMTEKKQSLAVAESCSGGTIAAKITRLAGASDYFVGGVVSYSNEMKMKALGVLYETLMRYGAVSRETVIEMAKGALKLTGADYALAISGIAGPSGGSDEKPVGTVFGAIAHRNGEIDAGLIPLRLKNERALIIETASNLILGMLYRKVRYGKRSLA
ncbi:MAG: CinA family nicotinamide mononucleotide deamidase-related protein [Simkaniaceae bacterium]|nr:CinA family nicotinamide mononucleotide deamidase-related protein [Simkaniaceae bacterium]